MFYFNNYQQYHKMKIILTTEFNNRGQLIIEIDWTRKSEKYKF